jgi:hypothetical protein
MADRLAESSEIGNASIDAAALLAQIEALRRRLAVLEERLPVNCAAQPSGRDTKRRTSTKVVVRLLTGAGLAMLAGGSLVYGQGAVQSAADALFISKEGRVGIGIGAANPAATLDVGGLLHVAQTTTPAVTSEGAYLGWNASGGVGETDFINNRGGGSGGFAFKNTPLSGNPIKDLMVISGAGNVDVAGTLTVSDKFTGRGDAILEKGLTISGSVGIGIGTATPVAKLDVVGGLLHVADNTGAPTVTSQGAYLGWNALTRSTGETDFINNRGGGSGGFAFMDTPSSGAPRTTLMTISGDGNVTVSGGVKIGTQSVSAAGGTEALRMIRGVVKGDGGPVAGSGFSVKKSGAGLYDIQFTPAFPSVPGASATQIYGDLFQGSAAATSGGGDTKDNAVIAHLSADRMRVKTGDGGGSASDRNFSFIVIGPR